MQNVPRFLLIGALFIAVLLEGGVIYFLDDRSLRLYVGLGLLLPIAWMFARTRVAEVISPMFLRRRQYSKMRAQVVLLLAEIRRLNWTAVDADRGFRSGDEALAEMDAIEGRLGDIIAEIRREAGRASDEPLTAPDEPSQSDE